jgi:signal transduction histidine kinase
MYQALGELSQLWTALIENAIDATNGEGTLKVTTRSRGEMAFVEIWDNGRESTTRFRRAFLSLLYYQAS